MFSIFRKEISFLNGDRHIIIIHQLRVAVVYMQTAANPTYRSSLLHQLLYRKHVLEEDDVPGLPAQLPPYLSQDLFNIIKKVKNESPLNITSLTEGDWSRLLAEHYVTMEFNFDSGRKEFRPCKAELACPTTGWSLSWSLFRQQGIPSDLSSFLWKCCWTSSAPRSVFTRWEPLPPLSASFASKRKELLSMSF